MQRDSLFQTDKRSEEKVKRERKGRAKGRERVREMVKVKEEQDRSRTAHPTNASQKKAMQKRGEVNFTLRAFFSLACMRRSRAPARH